MTNDHSIAEWIVNNLELRRLSEVNVQVHFEPSFLLVTTVEDPIVGLNHCESLCHSRILEGVLKARNSGLWVKLSCGL